MKLNRIALATAALAMPLTLLAQQTTYGERHDIDGREAAQQSRVVQGDRSGQLTPGETSHIESQEKGIRQEDHSMRADDGGHLTSADRHSLAQQQNHMSHEIYRDKHNARRDPGTPLR